MQKLGDSDVAEIIMGQSPPSEVYNSNGKGLPFFQGKADFGFISPTVRQWCSAPIRVAKKNDILLSVRAPVGDVNLCKEECCIGRGLVAIRCNRLSFYWFLFFYLLENRKQLENYGTGTTFKSINKEAISEFQVWLPHLTEQKKIAAILFKIQEAIEIQESIIEKARELKKSTLHHVFTHGLRGEKTKKTEIGPMPESWDVVPIGKVYDFTKKPKEIIYSNYDHLPFIAMDLIPIDLPHSGKFKFKKVTEISSGTYIEDGDILLAKITPCFENGKQCIVTGLPNGFGVATTEVIPIKEKPGISDRYLLYYYLLKDDVRKLLAGKMEGATGRQRIPVNLLQEFMIPFPLLTEQQEMAELFLTIDQKSEIHTAKKSTLQDLFKTILNKLMMGEIRVKDLDIDVSEVST